MREKYKNRYKVIGDGKNARVEIMVTVTRHKIPHKDVPNYEDYKEYVEDKRQRMLSKIVDGCHAALLPTFFAEQITIKEINKQ